MSTRRAVLSCLCLALLLSSPAFSAPPTPDELLKMMSDKDAKMQNVSADFTINSSIRGDKSVIAVHNVVANIDGARKFLVTYQMPVNWSNPALISCIRLFDGKFLWHQTQYPGKPVIIIKFSGSRALKEGAGPTASVNRIANLKKQFDFAPVTEDTIDGLKVYALKCTRKAGLPADGPDSVAADTTLHIDQKSLAMKREFYFDNNGAEIGRIDVSNVIFDAKIDPKTFTYTPTADADITDMPATPEK